MGGAGDEGRRPAHDRSRTRGSCSDSCSPAPSRRSSTARVGSSSRGTCGRFAGLEHEALVLGSRDHAEVWAPGALGDLQPGARGPRPSPTRSPVWGSDVAPHALPGSARDPQPTDGGVMEEGHLPVMPDEVLGTLSPMPGSLQIDATVGGGGHTERILEAASPDGRVLGLDADQAAIDRVAIRLARFGDRLVLRRSNFRELAEVAPAAGFGAVDGMLFDLGLSLVPARRPRAGLRLPGRRPARHALRHDARRPRLGPHRDPRRPTSSRRCSASTARSRPRGGSRRRSSPPGPPQPIETAEDLASLIERIDPGQPAPAPPHPPCDARVPGAPDRGQRGARRARGRAGRGDGPAAAGRPPRRPVLPLARGPDRQAVHQRRAAGLHLPARGPGLRLRPRAAPPPRDRRT